MGQLVKLTLISRGTKSLGSVAGAFDIDDIVTPIRFNGANSYFSARMLKGTVAGAARNQAKQDYIVSQTLSQIAALSSKFITLTVSKRRNATINSETTLFNTSRISEGIFIGVLNTHGGGSHLGSQFFYCEDGDPLPVQYFVNETIDQIITQDTTYIPSVPAASPTTITYDLTSSTNMDLTGNTGELIVNVISTGSNETLATFANFTNVTKITLRPANGLTLAVTSDSSGGAGIAGAPRLVAPTITIFGSFSGYLEMTKRTVTTKNVGFYQTGSVDQYTAL